MKTPVTVLSDMLRAIRDAEHAQRISETTERASRKADLLRGGLTSGNKKQTETGLTNPVNEQNAQRYVKRAQNRQKRDFRIRKRLINQHKEKRHENLYRRRLHQHQAGMD